MKPLTTPLILLPCTDFFSDRCFEKIDVLEGSTFTSSQRVQVPTNLVPLKGYIGYLGIHMGYMGIYIYIHMDIWGLGFRVHVPNN